MTKAPTPIKFPAFWNWSQRKKERLLKLIKDYEINGVIFLYYNFCDPDAFESRRLTQFLAQYDIDSIIVQTDPQLSNLQQLTTRIEAFLEIWLTNGK